MAAQEESTSDSASPNSLLNNIAIRFKPQKPRFRVLSAALRDGENISTLENRVSGAAGNDLVLYLTSSVPVSSVMDGKCCAEKTQMLSKTLT